MGGKSQTRFFTSASPHFTFYTRAFRALRCRLSPRKLACWLLIKNAFLRWLSAFSLEGPRDQVLLDAEPSSLNFYGGDLQPVFLALMRVD